MRYKGTKTIAISPDYSEVAKLCDQWLSPKQGTDSALAMAMGHVILKEFHLTNPSDYFLSYARRYTDMPMLVLLEENEAGYYTSGRLLRAADLADGLGETNNPEWKTVAFSETGDWWRRTAPPVSAGAKGQMEHGTAGGGREVTLRLSLIDHRDDVAPVAFPYYGGNESPNFRHVKQDPILLHQLPVKHITTADGTAGRVVTVYDLLLANYGLDRGLDDANCAQSYDDVKPIRPHGRSRSAACRVSIWRLSRASSPRLPTKRADAR